MDEHCFLGGGYGFGFNEGLILPFIIEDIKWKQPRCVAVHTCNEPEFSLSLCCLGDFGQDQERFAKLTPPETRLVLGDVEAPLLPLKIEAENLGIPFRSTRSDQLNHTRSTLERLNDSIQMLVWVEKFHSDSLFS